MACAAPSRDNLGVQGPCGKPDYQPSLCLFHWEMKNGLLDRRAANMFLNPGAETDLLGWSQFYPITLTRSNAQARSGAWSVRCIPSAQDCGPLFQGPILDPGVQRIPCQPLTTYTASAWVRPDSDAGFSILIQEYTAGDVFTTQAGSVVTTAPAGIWTPYTVTATLGATAGKLQAFLLFDYIATIIGFYVDDVGIIPGTIPAI